nr:hypothetical protein [Tanacetum cinerariifolium]
MKSREMRETKAYETYLGYATGVSPPKRERKFKKHASFKLSNVPASPDEPTKKSKRVKRPAKESSDAPTAGFVIRKTPMKSLSKMKKKMTVKKRKGIDFLSEVALTEEAQSERSDQERDSDDDKAQSDIKKGSDSKHETDENESGSESDQEENEEEDETNKEEKNDEFVRTMSNDTDDDDETKIKDKAKGDEDEVMDYTTNQFDDDVNVSLNEPVDTDEGFIQKEGTDAEMTNVQQGNENPEISRVIKDAYHAILAKESSQPKSTYEAASSLMEFELKKILIDKMNESQSYLTAPKHIECYDGLIKSYDLDKSLFSTFDKMYLLKRSRKDKDKDEDPSAGSERGLKKRKTSKDAKPTKCLKAKESQSGSSKDAKSQSKSFGKSI